MKPVLYLDMDGVLADFEGWAADTFGEHEWKREINLPNWGLFTKYTNIFSLLPLMPGAIELYNHCVDIMEDKNQVQILTALPQRSPEMLQTAAQHKIEWARKHISKDVRVRFGPFAKDKKFHVHQSDDVLVDDVSSNIEEWRAAGGHGILHLDAQRSIIDLEVWKRNLIFRSA